MSQDKAEPTSRDLYTAIGHGSIRYHNPCSEETHARAVSLLVQHLQRTTNSDSSLLVLDVGCGAATLLDSTVGALHAALDVASLRGLGVDASPLAIAQGLANLSNPELVDLEQGRFEADKWEGKVDVLLCVGSVHILGDSPSAYLAQARRLLKDSASVALLGDLYVRGEAPVEDAFVDIFGFDTSLGDMQQEAEKAGFHVVESIAASSEELADYEQQLAANRAAWIDEHETHKHHKEISGRHQGWAAIAKQWGHRFGFALHVLTV